METYGGGPKQIAKEIVENLSQLTNDLQIQIKLKSQITDADELLFPCNVYKSVLLHIILWSINLSRPVSCIYVDISIEVVKDGEICTKSNDSYYKSSRSSNDSESNLGETEQSIQTTEENEGIQNFLQTCVYFESQEDIATNSDIQAQIKKETNYVVSKQSTASLGGKLTHLIDQKVLMTQVLFPLDEEVVNALQDVKH